MQTEFSSNRKESAPYTFVVVIIIINIKRNSLKSQFTKIE